MADNRTMVEQEVLDNCRDRLSRCSDKLLTAKYLAAILGPIAIAVSGIAGYSLGRRSIHRPERTGQ